MEDKNPYAPPQAVKTSSDLEIGLRKLAITREPLFDDEFLARDGFFLDTEHVKQMGSCLQFLEASIEPTLQSPTLVLQGTHSFCYYGVPGESYRIGADGHKERYCPSTNLVLKVEACIELTKMIVTNFSLVLQDPRKPGYPVDWRKIGGKLWP